MPGIGQASDSVDQGLRLSQSKPSRSVGGWGRRRQPGRPGGPWLVAGAVLADLCAVAIYVTVGRSSHHESLSVGGLLTTGWPFVVGVAGGYVGAGLTRWPVAGLRGGAVIVAKCLVLGLVLRFGVQRAGTPFTYIVVTVLVLTALMGGWRLAGLARGRLVSSTSRPRERARASS